MFDTKNSLGIIEYNLIEYSFNAPTKTPRSPFLPVQTIKALKIILLYYNIVIVKGCSLKHNLI